MSIRKQIQQEISNYSVDKITNMIAVLNEVIEIKCSVIRATKLEIAQYRDDIKFYKLKIKVLTDELIKRR